MLHVRWCQAGGANPEEIKTQLTNAHTKAFPKQPTSRAHMQQLNTILQHMQQHYIEYNNILQSAQR